VHGAAWLFGAAVAAGLALRPALGDALFLTRYTGYVMPWLSVGLLPGAACAWWARRRALAAVLGVSTAVVLGIHAPLFRPRAVVVPSGPTLEVMSYNTWSRNADAARIARVIRAERPDVLLLQEIPPEVFERVSEALRDLYGESPLHSAYDPWIQQAVLSRYPVEGRASMARKGQTQRVVLRSPLGPIAIFNVHPLRTGGWQQRYGQIAALLEEEILREPSPVILAGDFNVTDRSQLYGLLAGHLENAHDVAGFGFGFTYPARVRVRATVPALPMARIDHVFFSRPLVAVRAGTLGDSGGSDHRPVVAVLGRRGEEGGPGR
jgi:endonuclease/exonuclease/phosphatase (EEP) superfamily protein YafD